MPRNIDLFNELVGLVFAQLYDRFPVASNIDRKKIGEAIGLELISSEINKKGQEQVKFVDPVEGLSFERLLLNTTRWLIHEGFIRSERNDAMVSVVLTSKALTALNAMPASLVPQEDERSFGDQLSGLARETATEARRSAITKIVGEVVGHFVRAATSSPA
ncbi:MAG: hypothetical protein C0606_16120 [Hyphomicrobiales bacterium]|nr:MAG: hypothetical protein C0606_16120 [Hyphomicrobiales bacterium]